MTPEQRPPIEDLLAHLSGEPVPPDSAARIVANDPACRAGLDRLRRILDALAAPPLAEVPPALLDSVVALAESETSTETRTGGVLRDLVASAREFVAERVEEFVDGLAGPGEPAVVLRGERGGGWRELYRGGPYEIDLGLLEGGDLVGQVVAVEDDAPELGFAWCCLFGDDGAHEATLEDNGDFLFEHVRPGAYALAVEANGARIVLPEVRVGGQAGDA